MNLPKLTTRQKEILTLLYKYRFLDRIQIQTFMKHKDYKTINVWLKDLREKEYIEWIYSTHFTEKTKPAIYYLTLNGIRHLKTTGDYPIPELRKRYRESTRSQTYIDRCLLLANCCLALEQARDEGGEEQSWYFYETETEFLNEDSYYHFILESELICPHLCFSKEVWEYFGEPYSTDNFFLEILDATLPRYQVRKRLSNYIKFFDEESEEWRERTGAEKLPVALFVFPTPRSLTAGIRQLRNLISEIWEEDDADRPHLRCTTLDQLHQQDPLSETIWKEV